MTPTINDFAVSVAAADNSFFKLNGITFASAPDGMPRIQCTSHFAEIDARWHGTPCRIYCPIDPASALETERVAAALKHLDSPVLASYRLLRHEMRMRNYEGNDPQFDIAIELLPEGERLDRLLADGITAERAARIAAAWIDTAEELDRILFSHRAIAKTKIIVGNDDRITLFGLHHGRVARSADDNRAIVEIALELIALATGHPAAVSASELAMSYPERRELCNRLRSLIELPQLGPAPHDDRHSITRELLDGVDFSDREWVGLPSEDRIIFRERGRFGYLDMFNRVVIEARFTHAENFAEGRAVVATESGFGLTDKQGHMILEPIFGDVTWSAQYNIAIVRAADGWAVYDSLGERLTRRPYEWLGNCSDRRIAARAGGRWGYLDTRGNEVVPFLYDDAFEYDNGRARVIRDGAMLTIDLSGSEIA